MYYYCEGRRVVRRWIKTERYGRTMEELDEGSITAEQMLPKL